MIVISQNLVLSAAEQLSADNAVIGWQNLVTSSNVSADSEDADFPATNLANPATNLRWQGASDSPIPSEQFITATINSVEPIDYVGIAGHNFGSTELIVSVEGTDGTTTGSPAELVWTELVPEFMTADDGPLICRFAPTALFAVRVRLQGIGSTVPRASVMYAGALLIMERGIYQGYGSIKHSRKTAVLNGMSESGQFLGRVVINQFVESPARFSLLTPAWYRSEFEPFMQNGRNLPFFFAWRPQSYPFEVAFAWLISDPAPMNATQHGLIEIELAMRGIV